MSNRKLLSMLLKRTGFGRVDCVEDGQAAVNYCRELSAEEQPGIIFMDNTMPNLVSATLHPPFLLCIFCTYNTCFDLALLTDRH